jgi:hypothetical protein
MKKYRVLHGKVIDAVSGRHESEEAVLSDKMAHFYRDRIEPIKSLSEIDPDEFVNMSDTKEDIKSFMDKYNIAYTDDMTKVELLSAIDNQ